MAGGAMHLMTAEERLVGPPMKRSDPVNRAQSTSPGWLAVGGCAARSSSVLVR
jgi:hypothetical protein